MLEHLYYTINIPDLQSFLFSCIFIWVYIYTYIYLHLDIYFHIYAISLPTLLQGMKVYCHFSLFRFPLSILYLLFILLLGTSSEEELKSLLKKVKVESEKVGLKLNIQKTKIMASGPITSWQIDGETVETVLDFIFWGSKITADGDCSHEIKRCLLLFFFFLHHVIIFNVQSL